MARALLILRMVGEGLVLATALAVLVWGTALVQILMTGYLR